MAIGEFKQHHGHEPGGAWSGCVACNPTYDPLHGLRKLIHVPTEDELTAIIYKARWIDGIKDGALCSDEAIAKAILKNLNEGK